MTNKSTLLTKFKSYLTTYITQIKSKQLLSAIHSTILRKKIRDFKEIIAINIFNYLKKILLIFDK